MKKKLIMVISNAALGCTNRQGRSNDTNKKYFFIGKVNRYRTKEPKFPPKNHKIVHLFA